MAKRQFQALLILTDLISMIVFSSAQTKKSSNHPSPASPAASASDPVLVGAGDIASCDDLAGAEATAKLIDKIPGTVFAAGDLAYPDGSAEQFGNCYGPRGAVSKTARAPRRAITSITVAEPLLTQATSEPQPVTL